MNSLVEEIVHLHQDLGPRIVVEAETIGSTVADKDQIARVLTNLIKNAIEATSDQKEATIWVRVQNADELQSVEVSVQDTGPGLTPDQAERVFEPYVTTKSGGTGLGLPISHRIAVEHGGDLTYTTPPEGGACFTLTLPHRGPPTLPTDPSV